MATPSETPNADERAITVTGDTLSLGADVFIHEHLFFDFSSRYEPPALLELANLRDEEITLGRLALLRENARSSLTNLRSPPRDVLMAELAALRAGRPAKSCAVIDCTIGPGRDLAGLVALSEASGVNIIASAGVTGDEASAVAEDEEALDALVDNLVAQLTQGVAVSPTATVRCGLLVAGDGALQPAGSKTREATLQAVGQAQLRTNAPLLVALPARVAVDGGVAALDIVRSLVTSHGADARRVIVGHAQNLLVESGAEAGGEVVFTSDGVRAYGGRAALRELLALGASLCFDSFGTAWGVSGCGVSPAGGGGGATSAAASAPSGPVDLGPLALPPPSDEAVAREVAALCAAGHAAQLLLSPGVWTRLQCEAFGGGGLRHLRRNFLPRLARAGAAAASGTLGGGPSADQQAVQQAFVAGNAAKLLTWWRPAADAPRLVKTWECASCHRRFEEAVNPAEALPTDQNYYEKFDFRYCGTPCLSAHRNAKFKLPFECPPPAPK